jgi:hypothetical protein
MVHLDAHEAKEMTAALMRMRLSMQANVTSAIDASKVLENDGDSLDDAISTHKDEVKGALKRTSLHLTQLQVVMKREKIYLTCSLIFFHIVVIYIFYKRFRIHYFVSVLKRLTPTPSLNTTVGNSYYTNSVTSVINESLAAGSTYESIKGDYNLGENVNHIVSENDNLAEVTIEADIFNPIVNEHGTNEEIVHDVTHQELDSHLPTTDSIDEDVTENTIAHDFSNENVLFTDGDVSIEHVEEDVDIAVHGDRETENDDEVEETKPLNENTKLETHDTADDAQ